MTKTFGETTKVIAIINQVISLRNFQTSRKNKLKFACQWLYNVVVISGYIVAQYMSEQIYLNTLASNDHFICSFLLFAFFFGYLCLTSVGLYQSKNVTILVNEIERVDANLRKLDCKIEYRSLYAHVIGYGLFWILTTLILTMFYLCWLIRFNLSFEYIVGILSYVIGRNITSIVLYDFKIYVYWLGCRFKQTNELLRTFLVEGHQIQMEDSVLDASNSSHKRFSLNRWLSEHSFHNSHVLPSNHPLNIKHESQSIKRVHLFQQIRVVHLQLCGISKMLNRIFNLQLVVFVSIILLYVTVLLYYIYSQFIVSGRLSQTLSITIILMSEVIVYCTRIILVCYNCEYTTSQANRTVQIVHACSVYEIDTELKDEILQFSLQMSHTQLGKLKPAMFKLNYSFIRNCVSFVATYLVIIIQWNQTFQVRSDNTSF